MKVWDCRQNSEQWENLRRGLPTASEFHRIICPSEGTIYRCVDCGLGHPRARKKCSACKGENCGELEPISVVKPSSQADGYMFRLIAESMGAALDDRQPNHWIDRGHELEASAISQYEFQRGVDTEPVGFCTTDDGLMGASPDRMVGDNGLVEAKCPSPQVHIRHMVLNDLEDDHKVQVQGQMLVTGRAWADVISFHPGFPSVIIRVERNENYISGMNAILVEFVTKLHRVRAELIAKYGDFRRLPVPVEASAGDGFGVTEEDTAAIWLNRQAF